MPLFSRQNSNLEVKRRGTLVIRGLCLYAHIFSTLRILYGTACIISVPVSADVLLSARWMVTREVHKFPCRMEVYPTYYGNNESEKEKYSKGLNFSKFDVLILLFTRCDYLTNWSANAAPSPTSS